jgi:phosphoribosyl 1,2-cyclic phosphodiesterase
LKIIFWGTRGSIAVPGDKTVKYGGNTTCLEVMLSDGSFLILDAGTGIRRLGKKLMDNGKKDINIFLTHPHWDHIQGFPFFAPMYKNDFKIVVHGWPTTNRKVKDTITDQMEGTYFPVDFSQLAADIDFVEIEDYKLNYNTAQLSFMRNNHPVICHGIKIEEQGKSFVFMTDNELDASKPATSWDKFVEFCYGADLLVHDAQYTSDEIDARKGWGHSPFTRVLDLAKEAKVKSVGLFHHDPEHSDECIDRIISESERYIKDNNLEITCFGAMEGQEKEI